MAAEPQLETIRERVTRGVQAALDDLRQLALPEQVDQAAQLHGIIQRLSEQLDDAMMDLEFIEARLATTG